MLLKIFYDSDELSEKQNVPTQVVVRSKSHGVTREGKLIQPSAKMERGPPDWGAEMVRFFKLFEDLSCSLLCFSGGGVPAVTRVDIRPDQARSNYNESESEARESPTGNDRRVDPPAAWRGSPETRVRPEQAACAPLDLAHRRL